MRDYGRIYSTFWTSEDIRSLTDDAKLLAAYLLSGPHMTICGVARLPDGYICEDLGWTPQRVSKGLGELFRKGFGNRCETTKWLFVRRFLIWNTPENPNQWKAARKVGESIPANCAWRTDFIEVFNSFAPESERLANRFETLPEGLPKPLPTQKQEQKQKQDQKQDIPRAAAHDLADQLKLIYPKRAGDLGWAKAEKAIGVRLAEGSTPHELLEGTRRYQAYCKATESIGTQYVKQAVTFYGPQKAYLDPWHLPATKADQRLQHNVDVAEAFIRGDRH